MQQGAITVALTKSSCVAEQKAWMSTQEELKRRGVAYRVYHVVDVHDPAGKSRQLMIIPRACQQLIISSPPLPNFVDLKEDLFRHLDDEYMTYQLNGEEKGATPSKTTMEFCRMLQSIFAGVDMMSCAVNLYYNTADPDRDLLIHGEGQQSHRLGFRLMQDAKTTMSLRIGSNNYSNEYARSLFSSIPNIRIGDGDLYYWSS
jgi:hypothetical protein